MSERNRILILIKKDVCLCWKISSHFYRHVSSSWFDSIWFDAVIQKIQGLVPSTFWLDLCFNYSPEKKENKSYWAFILIHIYILPRTLHFSWKEQLYKYLPSFIALNVLMSSNLCVFDCLCHLFWKLLI